MNRRTRTLIVVVIAVVCATAATFGVLVAVRSIPPKIVEAPQDKVVVAARDVAQGICLTEDDIKVVSWPARTKVTGASSDPKAVLKRGLIAGVVANEPLTDAKLALPAAGCGLPPAIREGMRAISVKVNEVIGVAGFVVPGARVDVLVTIRQNNSSASRAVVSNAQVLTAGTRIDQQQAKDGKPIPTTVVTLMVSPEDAERIALAAMEGQLLLTLRNPMDTGATITTGIDTARLLGAPTVSAESAKTTAKPQPPRAARRLDAAARAPAPAPAAMPTPYVVDSIRAGKRAQEVVK